MAIAGHRSAGDAAIDTVLESSLPQEMLSLPPTVRLLLSVSMALSVIRPSPAGLPNASSSA